MSIYANFDTEEQSQFASNTGWGDVIRWSDSLDVKAASEIVHLCEYGWSQNLPLLQSQLKAAVATQKPASDVVSTVRSLLAAILDARLGKNKATVLVVSDGTSPS